MRHVVLVAPHFLRNTLRYISAFVELPGVAVSLVSEDPSTGLPPALRERVAGHYAVQSCVDAGELVRACRAISKGVGPIDRLNGVLEQLQVPVAEARDAVGIEGMGLQVALGFRDKDRMKEVLRGAGVPVARSTLATSPEELLAFARAVGFPIIVKPPAGLGAKATFRIASEDQLRGMLALGLAPSRAQPAQAEEFIVGREFTCETVTIHGRPVWCSGTRYMPSPLEVLENPWMQYVVVLPREEDDPTWRRFDPINAAALRALGVGTALSHMEWFLRDDGAMFVGEVGARPPGAQIMHMTGLVHDMDMIERWAELMTFDRFEAKPRKYAAGVAFLRGQGHGERIVGLRGWDRVREAIGDRIVDINMPAIGQPKAEGYEGEGYVVVRHPTTEGVMAALRELVTNVRIELG